jgi:alpha-N-arabinofuranosidase
MDVMMKNIPRHMMNGVSLHNYTFTEGWTNKGDATGFTEDDYFKLLEHGNRMDELVTKHTAIMDKYDPNKRISLVVDEWGAWYNPAQGSNPGFLQQQNTLRDALLAGNILNIFHKHADRVKIANIAQMVNVLQAIIMTDGNKMLLTPTYYVFDMYKVHQDATLIPLEVQSPEYSRLNRSLKAVSASASKDKSGAIHISLVNIDPKNDIEIACVLKIASKAKITNGQLITAKSIDSHNTFDNPYQVELLNFKDAKLKGETLTVKLPAKSLVTIEIK